MVGGRFVLFLALLALGACSREQRALDPDQPLTPPSGPKDPRTAHILGNQYLISSGGRYFTWYGCGQCHGLGAKGVLDLGDQNWRHGSSVDAVYRIIAEGHGKLGARIPIEELWQLTAYVKALPSYDPSYRHRQDVDQVGEPQADNWQGPVQ